MQCVCARHQGLMESQSKQDEGNGLLYELALEGQSCLGYLHSLMSLHSTSDCIVQFPESFV